MLLLRRSIANLPKHTRPLQSLLSEALAGPSPKPSPGDASCSQAGQQLTHSTSVRHFNAKAALASLYKGASDIFNIPSIMHPDVYNTGEKQAADTYKYHGKIMHPYFKPRPFSWNLYANENEGWDELERRTRYLWNRVWAYRVCRQSLWAFSSKGLREHVIQVYQEVNTALAEGHKGKQALEPIKRLVSPALLSQLQGEASRMQQSGRTVEWKMVREPGLDDVKLVNGFLVRAVDDPQTNIKLHFVQWTVEVHSEQTFAVYEGATGSSKGKQHGGSAQSRGPLLAGDPDTPIKVVDYWVFERPVFKSWIIPKPGPRGAKWTLVARLKQPEGRPPALRADPV